MTSASLGYDYGRKYQYLVEMRLPPYLSGYIHRVHWPATIDRDPHDAPLRSPLPGLNTSVTIHFQMTLRRPRSFSR